MDTASVEGDGMAYQDGFKQSFTGLDPLAALQEPITSLLGVSAEAATALGTLGIVTVFDLAAAPVFQVAREIAEIAEGGGTSAMARLGIVPGGLLDAGQAIAPAALAAAPIADLNAVDDALASTLTARLQVETIGELGRWAAFRAAQEVLAAATMPDSSQDGAEELVPRLGEFPTERRFYQSVIIDHVATGKTTDLATAGPIDIAPTIGAGFGFAAPAVGARLTFAQSWFAHGVTLGNLLHSVALAPGESTRLAMLDWSRQTSASATEDITQAEQLTQATSHNRAVSEVQDAVAQEAQSGFSSTHAEASTSSGGGGFGLSLGPLTIGGTGSGSGTTSDAQSFSASTGSRSLAASMNQNVMDATQQAASSVRNRRASIVKEVSEAEHEAVSTRIVANYNHMHALTVQYFEVLELYRVSSHLHQVERCLFVPMKLVMFTDALVAHYRGVLADAALDQHAREMLTTEYGVVRVHPVLPMRRPIDVFGHLIAVQRMAVSSTVVPSPASSAPAGPASTAPGSPAGANAAGSAAGGPGATTVAGDGDAPVMSAPASWSDEEMARAARIIAVGPARPGTSDLFLPDDAELAGVSFSGAAPDGSAVPISAVQVRLRTGEAHDLVAAGPIDWSLATPVPLQDLEDVRVSSSATTRFDGQLTLQLSYHGARFPLTAPLAVAGQAVLTEVVTIGAPESGAELLGHLQQNQLHYSQAIWQSLDASSIALLLSAYTFESLPVADLIDPNPIMIAGNYLVFRMPGFTRTAGLAEPADGANAPAAEAAIRESWEAWLTARGLVLGAEAAAEELVSVPTGGVFAEAVLGRSNSAELLDATRFWNWQDSPIPLQPPEIAAIQMESRAQPEDVTPGQLGAPVLNIMNPTTLPDPAGLAPMLAALQNGNMFRDMSGLAATVGLAQALGQDTSTAASDAGKQAAANLAVAAQKDIAEKQIAAQLAMAAMGMPGGSAGTPKNISESGALLNTAKALDAQAAKGQPTTGTAGPATSVGGTSHSGGSGSGGPLMPGVSGSLPPASSGSFQSDVMKRALGGIGADLIPAALSIGSGGAAAAGGSTGGATSTTPPQPWHAAIAQIYEDIDASGLGSFQWTGKGGPGSLGPAPLGYLKGMALTYARVYCDYSLEPGLPEDLRDPFAVQMAKAVAPGTPASYPDALAAGPGAIFDAVAWYAADLQALGADLSVDGVDVLRGVFTILFGLGMRESSGKYCTGRDTTATAPTATNSETGLFQVSYDTGASKGYFKALYERYQRGLDSSFLDVFREGVTCSAADWGNFGTGPGKDFQQFSKDRPDFAAEFAALAVRQNPSYSGPLRRQEVEIREECWTLLRRVEAAIDDLNGCNAVV
jgi:hypothetical protein